MLYEGYGAALATKKKGRYIYLFLLMDVYALSYFVGFIFKKARSRPRSFLTRSIRFRFTTIYIADLTHFQHSVLEISLVLVLELISPEI